MSILNHLFGNREDLAKEIAMDDCEKRKLWPKQVSNFASIKYISMGFSFSEVDNALHNQQGTEERLAKIKAVISPELVSIGTEVRLEEEIIADLKRLKSTEEIENLSRALVYEGDKQSKLLSVMQEIFRNWLLVLHLIEIYGKTADRRKCLLEIFKLISRNGVLYRPFMQESYVGNNKDIHAEVMRIARAIIFNEKITERVRTEIKSDAEIFAGKMVSQMHPDERKGTYRKLGEDIYLSLAAMAGAPIKRGNDITEGIKLMERLMKRDDLMRKIVKKLRPGYNDTKVIGTILAFREAYRLSHFDELESEFVT